MEVQNVTGLLLVSARGQAPEASASPPCMVFLWEEGWENWEEANSLPHAKQEQKCVLWEGDCADDGLDDRARALVPPCTSARQQQPCGQWLWHKPSMGTPGSGQREREQGIYQPSKEAAGLGEACCPSVGNIQLIPVTARWHVLLRHPSFMVVDGDTVAPAGMAPLFYLEIGHRRGQTLDPRALRTHAASGCERHLSAHQVQEERDSQPLLSKQRGSRSQGCLL